MAYTKTTWVDRLVEYANRFTKSNETATSVTLTADPGVVTQAGTPISAANLNKIEQGIEASDIQLRNSQIENIGYGVQTGLGVTALATPGMSVNVAAGTIYLPDGTRYALTSKTLAVTAADATNPRKDIVYVSSTGVITYLAGTPAATPAEPGLPSGAMKLCVIDVPAGDTAIEQAQIADRRVLKKAVAYKNELDAHAVRTDNPHAVTAAQIGASNILSQLLTVDGAGSGLDADMLDGIDSIRLPFGANGSASNSVADFNTITKSGFYDGSNAANRPNTAYNWFYVLHVAHVSDSPFWGMQMAMSFDNEDEFYVRKSMRGAGDVRTWTPWRKMWHDNRLRWNAAGYLEYNDGGTWRAVGTNFNSMTTQTANGTYYKSGAAAGTTIDIVSVTGKGILTDFQVFQSYGSYENIYFVVDGVVKTMDAVIGGVGYKPTYGGYYTPNGGAPYNFVVAKSFLVPFNSSLIIQVKNDDAASRTMGTSYFTTAYLLS